MNANELVSTLQSKGYNVIQNDDEVTLLQKQGSNGVVLHVIVSAAGVGYSFTRGAYEKSFFKYINTDVIDVDILDNILKLTNAWELDNVNALELFEELVAYIQENKSPWHSINFNVDPDEDYISINTSIKDVSIGKIYIDQSQTNIYNVEYFKNVNGPTGAISEQRGYQLETLQELLQVLSDIDNLELKSQQEDLWKDELDPYSLAEYFGEQQLQPKEVLTHAEIDAEIKAEVVETMQDLKNLGEKLKQELMDENLEDVLYILDTVTRDIYIYQDNPAWARPIRLGYISVIDSNVFRLYLEIPCSAHILTKEELKVAVPEVVDTFNKYGKTIILLK